MKPEEQARQQIDAQLVACGWAIQDYAQFNPAAARGIALREVPLKSGQCDYLLLVDRKPVGVIEAKKEGTLLSGVAEQSAHYAVSLPAFFKVERNELPFLYESTGVETYFRNTCDPEPRSRHVFTFHKSMPVSQAGLRNKINSPRLPGEGPGVRASRVLILSNSHGSNSSAITLPRP